MPETDNQPTGDAVAAQTAGSDDEIDIKNDDGSVNWQQAARKWERESKKRDQRIAELEPKAKQFEIFEAASKSELERAQEQASALQQELATTQREALFASVALEVGLKPSQVKRLNRDLTTREELLADAQELLAESGSTGTRAPAPDRSQGSSATAATTDPAQQFASIIRSQIGS